VDFIDSILSGKKNRQALLLAASLLRRYGEKERWIEIV